MTRSVTPRQLPVFTVGEAAELLGLHVQTIYGYLNDGTFEECTTRGQTTRLIDEDSLMQFKSAREAKRG